MTEVERRTKRRYAHELYPHGDEWETRSLTVEVPYLYARAIGHEVQGTGWFSIRGDEVFGRTIALIDARRIAFMADAMLQGLTGQAAWVWADEHASEETGELAHDRAVHYGVPVDDIKPYECGPEPDHHDHSGEPNSKGWRTVTRVKGKESECLDCTELVPEPSEPLAGFDELTKENPNAGQ